MLLPLIESVSVDDHIGDGLSLKPIELLLGADAWDRPYSVLTFGFRLLAKIEQPTLQSSTVMTVVEALGRKDSEWHYCPWP